MKTFSKGCHSGKIVFSEALAEGNSILSGIPYSFFFKPNGIPHKFSFATLKRVKEKILRNDTEGVVL